MAWSSSLKRWTVTTGPNTSSWTISLFCAGPGDDRRLEVGAGASGPMAAGDDLGPPDLGRPLDHALDLVGLGAGDERAHLDVVALGRIAPLDRLDLVGQVGHEAVVDLRSGDHPARGGAVLAGVPVAEDLEVLDDRVESASSKTMTGALPPSSRWSRLTMSAAVRAMCLPVSVSPVTEIIPTFGWATSASPIAAPVPVMTLSTPGGRMSAAISAEDQRGQRRPGGRLEDDRVAGHQRRPDLPAGHHDRVVPRRDRGDHADRLASDQARVAGEVLVGGLALEDAAGAGEEAQVVDDHRDLVDRRTDRLARVLRLDPADLVGPRLDRVGQLEHQQAAVLGRRVLPASRRRVAAALRGPIDVLRPGRLDVGDDLSVGRVLDGQRLAAGAVDPGSADELLVGLDALEGVGHGTASWAGGLSRGRDQAMWDLIVRSRGKRVSACGRTAPKPSRRCLEVAQRSTPTGPVGQSRCSPDPSTARRRPGRRGRARRPRSPASSPQTATGTPAEPAAIDDRTDGAQDRRARGRRGRRPSAGFVRSAANTYCVRSFVPMLTKATRRTSSGASQTADGTSTMIPATSRSAASGAAGHRSRPPRPGARRTGRRRRRSPPSAP